MGSDVWIAGGGLVVSIFFSAGGIIWKLAENKAAILEKLDRHKAEIDDELTALRLSAYEEYKTLRKEIAEGAALARREFAETIHAIREKVTQLEIQLLTESKDTRHTLYGSLDQRHVIVMERVDETNERLRQLELFSARERGFKPDA